MRTYKIYTAGKMSGLTEDEQMRWRLEFEHLLRIYTHLKSKSFVCVHPPEYYQYDKSYHQTEREAMQWDLAQIRDSDIVVVNLDNIADSIGTNMELGYSEGMNQFGAHHIHVIGIGASNIDHPWIGEMMFRHAQTVNEAAEYIAEYLLL